MSITYEEALSTLKSMFGPPWTEETLDAVLRHHEGHMENTVETVLSHGDGDPDVLVHKLRNPGSGISLDEEIARQLANESSGGEVRRTTVTTTAPAPTKKGKGTPTELPPDFLRIPGREYESNSLDADEALARMLQDELFAQELRNNPEFAHLARRPGISALGGGSRRNMTGSSAFYPGVTRGRSNTTPVNEGPGIVEALSEMGENAKKRLSLLAARFQANLNNNNSGGAFGGGGGAFGGGGGAFGGSTGAAEQRGLLSSTDDDEEVSFFNRPSSNDVEMRPISSRNNKKRD